MKLTHEAIPAWAVGIYERANDRYFLFEPRPPTSLPSHRQGTQNRRRYGPVAAIPEPQAGTGWNRPRAGSFFSQTISEMYLVCFGNSLRRNCFHASFPPIQNRHLKSSQRYLKFWDEEEVGNKVLAQRAQGFGKIGKGLSSRAWRLGAITFFVTTVSSIKC